jgi:hypothetical protein
VALFVVPFVGVVVLYVYTIWRGHSFVIKKKASPLELHDTPLFADARWRSTLFRHTLYWLAWGIGIPIVLLLIHQRFIHGFGFF